ncbi:hypothetical protein POX_g09170 [Penicillium oxalicum]|nr:hypothetical protein POX_g09170 [Penicillium oxalicum]KAI2786776.1 hypothetical protein POX_g09170 [Penicillium oxalicum]
MFASVTRCRLVTSLNRTVASQSLTAGWILSSVLQDVPEVRAK